VHEFLAKLSVGKVWGIGPQTTAFLSGHGIQSALDLVLRDEAWTLRNLSKPIREIWRELRGESILPLELSPKVQQSIGKTKTFTPPSGDRAFVEAQFAKNVENACIKARRHGLATKRIIVYLRRQDFRHRVGEVRLLTPTNIPEEVLIATTDTLRGIFVPGTLYRASGVVLADLVLATPMQADLFDTSGTHEAWREVHAAADALDRRYGKHTVFLAASLPALRRGPHASRESGRQAARTETLFRGETVRKRLGVAFMGEVK
jgi:hypothetical protein